MLQTQKVLQHLSDIDWNYPLEEQLAPNFTGGPRETTSFDDLCMLRRQIPKMDKRSFDQIYPNDNIIRVVQKTHGVHEVHMREVAAWVLTGTHWFSLLKQPMMIVIWCRDWSDAAKFQYLMQILQVHFQDYVPRYHIFLSIRKTMLTSLFSIGNSQQQYGMVKSMSTSLSLISYSVMVFIRARALSLLPVAIPPFLFD